MVNGDRFKTCRRSCFTTAANTRLGRLAFGGIERSGQSRMAGIDRRKDVNGARRQKEWVLFFEMMAAVSLAKRHTWIGPRNARLPRAANRKQSQTDCKQSDFLSGRTFGGASLRE